MAVTDSPGRHLTLVGHSYGSLVVGRALHDHDPAADDAVLLGSPGAGVAHADDLRLPDGHVFVGAASRDPVSYLGWFGPDPASRDFGAVRFEAEDVTRSQGRVALADHSKYFWPGSESLSNIVKVTVGQDDSVRRAPYRGLVSWQLTGWRGDPEWERRPAAVPWARPQP
jgi:pimeloyl-ACP methyl ester carboxylesterase